MQGCDNSESVQRANIGACQNRVEYVMSNIYNTSENLQSAESLIRDSDMAVEITERVRLMILREVGQAMFAHANHNNETVLHLLS